MRKKKTKMRKARIAGKEPKKSSLISQIHRIIGQIKAVERMIEQGKSEKEVLMLIDAASNSLRSLRNAFIKESIRGKLASELDEMLSLVDR